MKKYLVKTISIATEQNPNFANQECISYHGKGQKTLCQRGSHAIAINSVIEMDNYLVKEYGYDRLCDAKRSYQFKHPENNKFWSSTSQIIEVEV